MRLHFFHAPNRSEGGFPVRLAGNRAPALIAARFADDTQNICVLSGFHTLLDNNSLWCMGTGGGTQVVKQEMTTRGSRKRSGPGHGP
jgi:hypothetical protein